MSRPHRRSGACCNVDETLFASKHAHSVSRMREQRETTGYRRRGAGNPNADMTMGESKSSEGPAPAMRRSDVVISRAQLDAIKSRATIVTPAQRAEAKRADADARRVTLAKADARKQRMLALEEQRKKEPASLTAEEEEDLVAHNETLARAADMRIEQVDQVKTMRRKMMYAQCAKIREAQLEEKQLAADEARAFDERQDVIMEVDRLQNLQRTESAKKKLESARRADAGKIREQIRERDRQRLIEEELLAQERDQMKLAIVAQEQAARDKRQAHAVASKALLEEVLAANDDAARLKAQRRAEEKEEDDKILAWQAEKRAQEEAHEQEKLALKAARDAEFFELARQMKRSMDNRSEQDALRAKRHQQEQERRDRLREKELKARQKAQLVELRVAREEQQARKTANLKRLAIADEEEWHKISKDNAEIQQRLDAVAQRQQEANVRHQLELREQMARREREAAQREEDKRKEAARIKRENQDFLRMVEKKKKQILQEMRDQDIPEKFLAEVEAMKVSLQ